MSKKLDKMVEEVEKERPLTPEDVFGQGSPIAEQILHDVIDENMSKPKEVVGLNSKAVGVEKAKEDGYSSDRGLLCHKDSKDHIPLPEADSIANKYGFMYVEQLVKALAELK